MAEGAARGVTGMARPFAGVELGGTKCVCTLAAGPDAIRDQRIVPTTVPQETLPAILAILQEWHRSTGFAALGIASFGPIDLDPGSVRHGHMLATPKPSWAGADIRGALSAPFDVPVGFDTDVNGAAIAEILWGSGRGLQDFAYVTVGTGVGVGLIVHGAPTRGIGHSEIGHLRVPRFPGDAAPSACPFHTDCVEGLASGAAIAQRRGARSFDTITPEDPLWDPVVHVLSAMCHGLVCATGPRRIAMGGGVIARQPQLLERINAALVQSLAGYMPLPGPGDYVVAPELGGQAGPLGSIALAMTARASRASARSQRHVPDGPGS